MLTLINEMGDKAPKSVKKYYGKIVPLAYQQGFLSIKGYIKKTAMELRGLRNQHQENLIIKREWQFGHINLLL